MGEKAALAYSMESPYNRSIKAVSGGIIYVQLPGK
jgi:hypothetical protein